MLDLSAVDQGRGSDSPDSLERQNVRGPGWGVFWCVFVVPLALGLVVEGFFGVGWEDRAAISAAICLLGLVVGCSCFCALWLVSRFCAQPQLRVFLAAGLVLLLTTVYVAVLVSIHCLARWVEQTG